MEEIIEQTLEEIIKETKIENIYKSNKFISETEIIQHYNDGNTNKCIKSVHFSKAIPTKKLKEITFAEDGGTIKELIQYKYDKFKNLIKTTRINNNDIDQSIVIDNNVLGTITKEKYHSNGKVKERIVKDKTTDTILCTREFNKNGVCISATTYEKGQQTFKREFHNDGKTVKKLETYENGKKITSELFDEQGKKTQEDIYSYKYDDKIQKSTLHNLNTEKTTIYNDKNKTGTVIDNNTITTETHYPNGNIKEKIIKDKTTDTILCTREFDTNGVCISAATYEKGQQTFKREFHDNGKTVKKLETYENGKRIKSELFNKQSNTEKSELFDKKGRKIQTDIYYSKYNNTIQKSTLYNPNTETTTTYDNTKNIITVSNKLDKIKTIIDNNTNIKTIEDYKNKTKTIIDNNTNITTIEDNNTITTETHYSNGNIKERTIKNKTDNKLISVEEFHDNGKTVKKLETYENGKRIKSELFDEQSKKTQENTYHSFDDDKVKQLTLYDINTGLETENKYFDSLGGLDKTIKYTYKDNTKQLDIYNANNKIEKTEIINIKDKSKEERIYDNKNKVKQVTKLHPNNEKKLEIFFDNNGKIEKVKTYYENRCNREYTFQNLDGFNKDEFLLLSTIEQENLLRQLIKQNTKCYTEYDENGKKIEELFYREDGKTTKKVIEYGENGIKTTETFFREDGKNIETMIEYSENGKKTTETFFREDGKTAEKMIGYSENGKKTTKTFFREDGSIEKIFVFDKYGKYINQIQVYNNNNKIVKTFEGERLLNIVFLFECNNIESLTPTFNEDETTIKSLATYNENTKNMQKEIFFRKDGTVRKIIEYNTNDKTINKIDFYNNKGQIIQTINKSQTLQTILNELKQVEYDDVGEIILYNNNNGTADFGRYKIDEKNNTKSEIFFKDGKKYIELFYLEDQTTIQKVRLWDICDNNLNSSEFILDKNINININKKDLLFSAHDDNIKHLTTKSKEYIVYHDKGRYTKGINIKEDNMDVNYIVEKIPNTRIVTKTIDDKKITSVFEKKECGWICTELRSLKNGITTVQPYPKENSINEQNNILKQLINLESDLNEILDPKTKIQMDGQ